jgi:hypothetical protein
LSNSRRAPLRASSRRCYPHYSSAQNTRARWADTLAGEQPLSQYSGAFEGPVGFGAAATGHVPAFPSWYPGYPYYQIHRNHNHALKDKGQWVVAKRGHNERHAHEQMSRWTHVKKIKGGKRARARARQRLEDRVRGLGNLPGIRGAPNQTAPLIKDYRFRV